MSADNSIAVFQYRSQSGEQVWVVAEVTLSGLPFEMANLMVDSRYRQHRAKNAETFQVLRNATPEQVMALARQMENALDCEYGMSLFDQTVFDRESITTAMHEAGWNRFEIDHLQEVV